MDNANVAVVLPSEEKVDAIEREFLALVVAIPEVGMALDYRPEMPDPDTVCMMFDDEVEVARVAGGGRGPTRVNWEWIVDIYVHGYERQEMQHRMRRIILQLREKLRENRLLNRTVKKEPELRSTGAIAPVRFGGNNPGLWKRYRLICEREV